MTPTYSATGRQRRIYVPPPARTVPPAPAPVQDPPIYRDLMRVWADRGRTLPGRHDPDTLSPVRQTLYPYYPGARFPERRRFYH